MDDFEQTAVEAALRDQLGKTASFRRLDRSVRTPMTFVLDEAERQLGSPVSVYWVDSGPPEVFCLSGFPSNPVVFSRRYLSISACIRHLFVDDRLRHLLENVAERTLLKVMAEMALWHRSGDPDYAVLALIKSMSVTGVWLDDGDRLLTLEAEPVSEAYMATWFYGLIHEIGHLHPGYQRSYPEGHLFSDAGMLAAVRAALGSFTSCPDSIRAEAIARATELRSQSVLGIDQVRGEGLADIFAASVLFQATLDIMREVNQERFRVEGFVAEMVIFLNIVATIERSRRVALIASAETGNREEQFESFVHPSSVHVRALMQRWYLQHALARYLVDTEPTPEQLTQVSKLIDQVNEHFRERIQAVDRGLARAMQFSLEPEGRENDWVVLENFRKELLEDTGGLSRIEAERFCELAKECGRQGKLLRELGNILENPSEPVLPDPVGDLVYLVPWVEGPEGFERPFGLDTRDGHLVFVFLAQGEAYKAFVERSRQALRPGFELKEAALPVPRKERLGPELAAHMPGGQAFEVVVEGTEEFGRYIRQLSEGTLWTEEAR